MFLPSGFDRRSHLVRPRPIATRIVLIWRVSAFSPRVRMGMTPTVACPWARRRLQGGWTSTSVSWSRWAPRWYSGLRSLLSAEKFCRSEQSVALATRGSCVVKTIFVKGVEGSTRVHRVKRDAEVRELLDCWADVWVTYNGKKVEMGDTMAGIGIGNHDTGDVSKVVLKGSGNCRQTFQASGRAWRVDKKGCVKTHCFRCGCPEGHDPQNPGPMGRPPRRSTPTNLTFKPNWRQNHQQALPAGTTHNFPPLAQPLPAAPVDASASGPVPSVSSGTR